MTEQDRRRAHYIGQLIAQRADETNPAAGLSPDRSFEALARANAELARNEQFQGVPNTTPLFETIMRLFRF